MVVGALGLAGAGQDMAGLGPDQRNVEGRLVIGFGGEQADETGLAGRTTIVAVTEHRDVIHVDAPVDPRLEVGLGDDDRFALFGAALEGVGQGGGLVGLPQDRATRVAQHAEAVDTLAQRLMSRVAAVGVAGVVDVAGAQEDEVLVLEPAQELHAFIADIPRQARSPGLQALDGVGHETGHGHVILDGQADVGEGFAQAGAHGVAAFLGEGVHDDQDHGLAGLLAGRARAALNAPAIDQRVEHGPDRDAGLGQIAHHAVDQEGPVVLYDLDQVVRRVYPGLGGGTDAHGRRRARLAFVGEGPEPRQNAGEGRAVDSRGLILDVVVVGLSQEGPLQRSEIPDAGLLREGVFEGFGGECGLAAVHDVFPNLGPSLPRGPLICCPDR